VDLCGMPTKSNNKCKCGGFSTTRTTMRLWSASVEMTHHRRGRKSRLLPDDIEGERKADYFRMTLRGRKGRLLLDDNEGEGKADYFRMRRTTLENFGFEQKKRAEDLLLSPSILTAWSQR
jgi:hypothetical protein